jgi:peptidoglycan/LPS O-acetylase OafA/YrhL
MIQRIQSIYLLLVFILTALMVFFPLVEFNSENQVFTMKIFSFENAENVLNLPNPWLIGMFTALLAITSLGTIFQFNNRKFQLKINGVSLLINFALLISIFVFTDKVAAMETVFDKPTYLYGSFFPVASVLFIILANRAIRKDEALVKKSERIR